MRILLNMDTEDMIDIHYLDPGSANFAFVTRMSIPPLRAASRIKPPDFAFSADGSKFAMEMPRGGVSVWNIQSKAPLQTFTETPLPEVLDKPQRFFQFSSGNSGKEILVFVEVRLMFTF